MIFEQNQMILGVFESFFEINEHEEFMENLHLFFQAEYQSKTIKTKRFLQKYNLLETFEKTIFSLIEPLHLEQSKVQIIKFMTLN